MSGPEFEGVPEHWSCYVAVDDAVAAATASGGQVIRPPFDVTGVGRIAILQDKGGTVIGIMKPAPMPDA
jgi:predicted enzyme related to lactoylglutathione lyase